MAHFRLRCFYLLTLALIVLPIARAYDFPPVSDEDKNFKEVPGQAGAPAAILFHEEIDDDVKNHFHMTYVRMKILTEAGRKYADVMVRFQKGWANIENVSARTVHADGTVIPFDGKVFDKEVLKTHGYKEHVKSFTLPDVQVGSIIEYRYFFRYWDQYFVAPFWEIQTDLWQKKVHFKFLPMDIWSHTLLDYRERTVQDISYTVFGPIQPKRSNLLTGGMQYEMEGTDVPAFVEEPHMMTAGKFRYNLHFYYITNKNPDDFWKTEGKFWNRDVEKFMGKKEGVAEQVNQLVTPSDTPEQKVQKIYAFVAGLENQSYIARRTEQEITALGMKDRGVADILKQKSGDRDDLTRLFVAMVRAAGVPAYVMKVTSRENDYFEPKYLSAEQLDSELAIVTLGSKDVFLDPGSKFCPYGLLNWQLTATGGLRQVNGGTTIAQTPNPTYMEAITQRTARFVMNNDGSLEGNFKVNFIGQEAMNRRQSALRTDSEGRKKDLEDEVKSWLPSGATVKLVQEPAWDASAREMSAVFHVQTAIANNAGKRVLLPLHIFQLNDKPMFPSAERVHGVYLYYPSREIDDISVTLPSSLDIENLPQNQNERLEYAMYKTEWSQQNRTITLKRDLAMAAFVVPQAEYKQLKGFYDKVKAGDEEQAVLRASANVVGQ